MEIPLKNKIIEEKINEEIKMIKNNKESIDDILKYLQRLGEVPKNENFLKGLEKTNLNTDLRENIILKKDLKFSIFTEIDVEYGKNSFFKSISKCLFNSEEYDIFLRALIYKSWIENKNNINLNNFIIINNRLISVGDYIKQFEILGNGCKDLEIYEIASIYDIIISVYSLTIDLTNENIFYKNIKNYYPKNNNNSNSQIIILKLSNDNNYKVMLYNNNSEKIEGKQIFDSLYKNNNLMQLLPIPKIKELEYSYSIEVKKNGNFNFLQGYIKIIEILINYCPNIEDSLGFHNFGVFLKEMIKNIIINSKNDKIVSWCSEITARYSNYLKISIIPIFSNNRKIIAKKVLLLDPSHNMNNLYKYGVTVWHGTKLESVDSIIREGFRIPGSELDKGVFVNIKENHIGLNVDFNGKKNWGKAIFVSPSIFYASYYSDNIFSEGEKWKLLLECRIKDDANFTKYQHTLTEYNYKYNEPIMLEYRFTNSLDLYLVSVTFVLENYLNNCVNYSDGQIFEKSEIERKINNF